MPLLFRSAVFAGYFDSEPLGGASATLLHSRSPERRACAIFRRGEHPDAGRFGGVAGQLLELPELRRRLGTDVKAASTATCGRELRGGILCYPALVAMTHYRFAHASAATGGRSSRG